MNERLEARVALVHAYTQLHEVLARLYEAGSAPAQRLWTRLPSWAPVSTRAEVRKALRLTEYATCVAHEAQPEWAAYRDAVAAFAADPLLGPAPESMPPGCIAAGALRRGSTWYAYEQRVPVLMTKSHNGYSLRTKIGLKA